MSTPHYGICTDCNISMPTKEIAQAHQEETWAKSLDKTSHLISVLQPETPEPLTPEQLADRSIDHEIETSIYDTIDKLIQLVRKGEVTQEQVTKRLHQYDDFSGAWSDYLADEEDDD